MVESTIKITQTQAEILQGISNFLTISDIAKHRKTSRQAIYKGIKILKEKGMIRKVGLAWRLSGAGKKGLHSFMGFTKELRQHNLHVKIDVLESPVNWDKKRNQLIQLPYFNKRVQLKNNTYDLLSYGKIQIKTTSKSVIVKLPTIFDPSTEGAVIQAMDIFYDKIPSIENLLKVKLIKDMKCNITFISQEYAKLDDALAKIYKKNEQKLYVTDEHGELRFIADYSFAVNEFEAVHPNKAADDMSATNPFLLDLAANPTTFTEVRGVVTEIMKVQQMQSYNIVKHQKVLDEMLKTLKKIGDKL